MSIKLMSLAWETALPDSEKLVLLALADWANDEGRCWPSMAQLVKKCSKSDRTIQLAIKMLKVKGHLERDERPGKGCVYIVHPIVRLATPEAASPRSNFAPEEIAPPKRLTSTPEAASDNTSITTNGSEAKASSPRRAKFLAPHGVPVSVWADFLASPKRRKAGMSDTAYAGIVRNLSELAEHGFPPGQMIALAVERGWTTVKLEWVTNDNDRRTHTMGRNQPADGLSSTARAAIAVFGR